MNNTPDGKGGAVQALTTSQPLALLATAPSSRGAYSSRFRRFTAWCAANHCDPLPAAPSTVVAYLEDGHCAGATYNTLKAWVAAISVAHGAAGLDSPCRSLVVRKTLAGAARLAGPPKQAPALTVEVLSALVRGASTVDRCCLLVGFFGALRGDDLQGLRWDRIEPTPWGVILHVRGKTEGGAELRRVPLGRREDALCPVRALEAWRADVDAGGDLVFPWAAGEHGRNHVAAVLKRCARTAGTACLWSAHSLRAGFVTAAHRAGVTEADIAATTGHRAAETLRGYIRTASLEERCATQRL